MKEEEGKGFWFEIRAKLSVMRRCNTTHASARARVFGRNASRRQAGPRLKYEQGSPTEHSIRSRCLPEDGGTWAVMA